MQRAATNFLWTLRTCSRYLEGSLILVLCVSENIGLVRHCNQKIFMKTKKKLFLTKNPRVGATITPQRLLRTLGYDPFLCECMKDEHFRSHSSTLNLFLDGQQMSMVKGSRTQMYYKQETFNLFLEDSEGFAKLVTYLGEIASQNLEIPFERFVNNLEIIIGRFGLNTDR